VIWSMLLVTSAKRPWCFGCWRTSVDAGHISLGEAVVYVQSAVGVSMICVSADSVGRLTERLPPSWRCCDWKPAMRPAGELALLAIAAAGRNTRRARFVSPRCHVSRTLAARRCWSTSI